MNDPLRVAVVGLRGMGMAHARSFAALPEFRVVAGCDLEPARTAEFASSFPGAATYADYARMLAAEKPGVVVVATNTVSHARLTMEAVMAGARGVMCEKPMAVGLGDAKAMVAACRERGTALIVNHQRRTQPVYTTMRKLAESGAIGKVELVRGSCAGDILSDGTHTVDSIRHLAGDAGVKWVVGQVVRDRPDPAAPRGMGYDASGGWRYGHPIETGAFALIEFATGLRAELHTGSLQIKGRQYQDVEVFGSAGRLWRAGDQAGDVVLIQDGKAGGFRSCPLMDPPDPGFVYRQFARMILDGTGHPLNGGSALADHEVVTAVYESARLRARIDLPLAQDRYPLELMI